MQLFSAADVVLKSIHVRVQLSPLRTKLHAEKVRNYVFSMQKIRFLSERKMSLRERYMLRNHNCMQFL